MKNVSVNELDVFDMNELENEFYIEGEMNGFDDVSENDVIEIMFGSRGEVEDIKKCNIVDGMFEVKDVNDIKNYLINENDDYDDGLFEYVYSDFEKINKKNVYSEVYFEESYSYFVRIK